MNVSRRGFTLIEVPFDRLASSELSVEDRALRQRKRTAFTLIEVLVTIGIILVLVGIVSVGITYVTKAGKNSAVKVSLNNLRGMIAELEAGAGLRGRQPAFQWDGTKQLNPPTVLNFWQDGRAATDTDPDAAANSPEPALVPAGIVTSEMSTGGTPERYNADVIANTQLAIGLLLADPDNKRMFGQFPPEQLMESIPAGVTCKLTPTPLAADRKVVPSMPLDPWGNPIIFVPGSGLCGNTGTGPDSMWVAGEPGFLNPSTTATQVVASPSGTNQVGPIRSPDGRPFWASAGPDGDFRTGDDNVYSFEN